METGGGEKRFHAQISWLMFVFSIFVIWVHSYNVDLFSCGAQDSIWILADQIENFVSVGLGQIAVPCFFLLSCYLFFRNFSGSLCGLEYHLLSGIYGGIAASRHAVGGGT